MVNSLLVQRVRAELWVVQSTGKVKRSDRKACMRRQSLQSCTQHRAGEGSRLQICCRELDSKIRSVHYYNAGAIDPQHIMEPGDKGAVFPCTMVQRLDPIVEDESEETERREGEQLPEAREDNDQAVSSSSDFVHINDCFKDKSEKKADQADALVSDLSIHLVMVRGGIPDAQLQGELRNRLRLLENDSKEVSVVLRELSARLLSIESDKDLITVTFRTLEEIWKFSTYHSLGFLSHCIENIFLDESFWLTSLEDEDARIQVLVNEESLSRIYKGLLMEEGMYYVFCADKCVRPAAAVDGAVQILLATNRPSADWTDSDPPMGDDRVISAKASAEVLCPFHQWFLKTNIGSDLMDFTASQLGNRIAVGWSEAVISHESNAPDEMTYQSGDMIETVSTYIECMEWFVGRNATTGSVGFVRTSHVKPYASNNGTDITSYLVEEDIMCTKSTADFDMESARALLHKISHSEVCHLYKLDRCEGIKDCHNREISSTTSTTNTNNLKDKLEKFLLMPSSPCPQDFSDVQANRTDSYQVHDICEEYEDPSFCIYEKEEKHESLQSLLLYLNSETFLPSFTKLYDVSYSFLKATFHGYDDEEELVRYLSLAREAAKKSSMTWSQARICFLLGRLCTKKHKFSQARVYFEEAMGVINGDFADNLLFTAVHMNLNAIYLRQKSKEKCMQMIDKSSSLILGLQKYITSTDMEPVVLKYALKKAILSKDRYSEIKVCRLLAKTFINLRQYSEALPFVERLQILHNTTDSNKGSLSRYYLQLADMYIHKCLPHLTLSCINVASQTSSSFMDSLRRVGFIIDNTSKLCVMKKPGQIFPAQVAYHLRQALKSAVTDQEQEFSTYIHLSLAELSIRHRLYKEAYSHIMKVVDTSVVINMMHRVDILVSLAWLYILDGKNTVALDILNTVVSLAVCTQLQLGIVHNLIGIALRREDKIKKSAEHYCKALQISRDTVSLQNQGAVLANFGTLCLHLDARIVAEQFLAKAVAIYSELPIMENRTDFINVLLILGQHHITGGHKEKGRFYYECALLVAMAANSLEGQLHAIQLLCHFYTAHVVNEAQCIIYNEYQLSVARKLCNKVLEGQVLETISQLFLSLGTERACRSALEYTKGSLGIFIDLQAKEKEANAWLMAGKIYYILEQTELVDLYIQVAQNVALCTGDPQLGMQLYEASGDIFFNGCSDRSKATTFYRDCALPLAVKTGNMEAELRLSNKLSELLASMELYEESLDHAKTALALSVNLGNQLNERVAYHRLAGIYSHLCQCELAEHYYLKALSLCPSPLELEEEAVYYMKVYLVLGDIIFYHLKDPYDAAGYYHLALAAAVDLGNKRCQLKIYTRLAIIYHHFLIDREKSLYFYQKARTFAAELNVRRINLSPEQHYQTLTRTYSY
ncbi:SH3 domain and tetratricopeptide repeat-containing protein 1 isoform X2 [Pseudophryne corroboree]|uniref:SH3 domain and tetratricopeptide repeat-containing protein 1 isoform X2 n=1 Tax=Pseudophryne corroboree TaxID=495146 RepID=UPI003081D4BD